MDELWMLYHVNRATGEAQPFTSHEFMCEMEARYRAKELRIGKGRGDASGSNWTVEARPAPKDSAAPRDRYWNIYFLQRFVATVIASREAQCREVMLARGYCAQDVAEMTCVDTSACGKAQYEARKGMRHA